MKQMKIAAFFLMCLIMPLVCNSQSESEKLKIKQKMWESDPDFKATAIKKEWQNKSAVVIARSLEYEVKKEVFIAYVYENVYTHERLMLNDKAAVNRYSEMTFDEKKTHSFGASYGWGQFFVGIKIIKPNGVEKEVDISESVLKEIKVGYEKRNYKKLAIPDLEPGDILDYYYVTQKTISDNVFERFDPVLYTFMEDYPIMKQKIRMNIMRKCYLSARSMNGAPELKETIDSDGNRSFSLIDENREAIEDQNWLYTYREVPTLKFQAFFTSAKGKNYYPQYAMFLGEAKSVKTAITKEEIQKYVNTIVASASSYHLKAMKKNVKRNIGSSDNIEEYIKEGYYYLRQKCFIEGLDAEVVNGKQNSYGMNNVYFIGTMSKFLTAKKINHDIVISIPRTIASLEDLLLYDEFEMLIRVNTPKQLFIGNFSVLSHYDDIHHLFQGNKAYSVNILGGVNMVQEITIPATGPEKNREIHELFVKLDNDNTDLIHIAGTSNISGIAKYNYMDLITYFDYIHDAKPQKYDIKQLTDSKAAQKDMAKTQARIQQKIDQDNQDRLKSLKGLLATNFNLEVDTVTGFELIQTGLWDETPELSFKDEFVVKGISNKAGKNYLINIGQLIGNQTKIEEKDKIRKHNIHMAYARTYEYNVNFKIPEGFAIKGIEKLNYNVNNAAGGFVSTATFNKDDQALLINTKKYYNHNYEKASDWPQMLSFLDAAYEFTQQKILLEKIEKTPVKSSPKTKARSSVKASR